MYAKDLASDDGSDRERVEDVDKGLPRLDVGTAFTLVVEPVDFSTSGVEQIGSCQSAQD